MKITLFPLFSRKGQPRLLPQLLFSVIVMGVAAGAMMAGAQTPIDKANSYTSLATGSDWAGAVVPGATNIAVWNSTAGTPVAEPLGANLNWAGIQILNPLGPVTITADGNTLTNGEVGVAGLNGIDMSAASQNLTLNNNVVVNGVQNWNVGPGETLTLGGALNANSGAAVRFNLAGSATAILSGIAPNSLLTNSSLTTVYGTYNGVDYAGLNASQQVVPGASLGIYTANSSGNPPSVSGTINGIIDCTNAGSGTYGGVRLSSTLTIWGLLFNETNAEFGNWQVNIPSTRNLTLNSILMTTNLQNNPVTIVQGSVGDADVVTIGGTLGRLLLYQNNPGAPLLFQAGLTIRQASASGTSCGLVKMGAGVADIQCNSTYTGGTMVYGGTLQIDGLGNVGAGALNVYGGAFAQSGPSTNAAPTTIYGGATNSVLVNSPNAQSIDSSTLAFNAGSTLLFVYSNTITPSAATPALMVTNANGLTLNGPVNLAVFCGGLSTGTFPLVSYAGVIGGSGFSALSSLTLPPHVYGYISNDVTHSLIDLVVTNVDQPIAWNTGSGVWDVGITANWLDALGVATAYQQLGPLGDNVVFNDNAPGPSPITVTLNTNVTPSSVGVNNVNNTYVIAGDGSIGGIGALTKSGSGTLTLATTNTFGGGINLDGGTVIFDTLGNLGSGAITFNGGALEYNGNVDDLSTRTVNLQAGGATINTAGQTVNFADPIGNNGAGGLTKSGAGTLILNGTNTYFGNTVVSQGTLELGAGTYLTNSAAIVVDSGAVLDTASSGVNLNLSTPASQILAGGGQVNGVVTVAPGTEVSPATNGVTGALTIDGGYVINGGTNFMDVAAASNDLIAVSGNLTLNGGTMQINLIGTVPDGRYTLITYSGSFSGSVANVTLLFPGGNQVAVLDSSVPGQIALVISTSAHDVLTWPGTGSSWDELGTADWLNGGTPWPFTNGDTVTFNDSETGGNTTVQLMTNVQPSLVTVSNTVVPIYTFADGTGSGGGKLAGDGSLVKDGAGTLIMQTANVYRGTTTIRNGTLQIGNGGAGDIGTGNVTNNAALVFQQGDSAPHLVAGAISGTGSLTENANATVILAGTNSYTGPTTIAAGTLQVGNGGATGSLGATSAVTNNGVLAINESGNLSFPYNVTGSGSLDDIGVGTVSLAGSSLSYQGNTYVSNGVVKLGANNELPNQNNVAGSTGYLNVDGGASTAGKLDMNGFNLTVNALSGQQNNVNGIITNSSTSASTTNVLTVLNTVATTYNGEIMDHGTTGAKIELFVTGPNTLTLNPTNSDLFSGGIVISNGTLALGTPGADGVVNINESQYAPGTGPITMLGTNAGLVMDGYTGSTTPTYTPLTNVITIPANQVASIYGPCRGTVGCILQGSGTLNYYSTYVRDGISGDWSGFTGTVVLSGNSTGGNIGFTLDTGIPNAGVIMTTDVAVYCTAGGTMPIGALSGGDSSCQIESTSSGNAGGVNTTFEIGGLNLSTTYSGGIVDTNNLLKVGSGTFTLNCGGVTETNVGLASDGFTVITNIGFGADIVTYHGTTTVSNGVLALDAPVVLTNSISVTIAAPGAVLDASAMGYVSNVYDADTGVTNSFLVTNSLFEVVSGQTLAGIGTLNGIVQADPGSIFDVGLPTGTFNVTSNISLSGAVIMNLDSTDAPVCSELAAPAIAVNSTATLVVTNIGPGLANGASFTLFNHPVSGFSSVILPATDPTGTNSYQWLNHLAIDGSITLTNGGLTVVPINPNPTNIVFSASGGNLHLTWPSDHTGWTLQVQASSLAAGIGTNWVAVPGSTTTNQEIIPMSLTNGAVFYRLIYTP